MATRYSAYCFRGGDIHIGTKMPEGALRLKSDTSKRRLRAEIEVTARHAYDGETMLVPGVPEADDDRAAVTAVMRYANWLAARDAKRQQNQETRA